MKVRNNKSFRIKIVINRDFNYEKIIKVKCKSLDWRIMKYWNNLSEC